MGNIHTETETVIKKILPYMKRRGYDIEKDFDFETAVSTTDRYTKGYVDILVTLGKTHPLFLMEAKRIGKNLTNKDRDQAISYARSKDIKVPFVVVTNGKDIQCFNTKNKQRIIWDGKRSDKVPSRSQVEKVIKTLKAKPDEIIINISNDDSLPFRQGLPLRQLNALFAKGHNT
ncbi:MAG: type I restriction enzyme HsdR N-terminal domain-containing protein, partial [Lachnospiraceae bacterium]|nr:type I restriction enzyme HsdR N-terminal domain-containing protein [Lachnospiraceae bacterium]